MKKQILLNLITGVVVVAEVALIARTAYRVGVMEENVDMLEEEVEKVKKVKMQQTRLGRKSNTANATAIHRTGNPGELKPEEMVPQWKVDYHPTISSISATQKHISELEIKIQRLERMIVTETKTILGKLDEYNGKKADYDEYDKIIDNLIGDATKSV